MKYKYKGREKEYGKEYRKKHKEETRRWHYRRHQEGVERNKSIIEQIKQVGCYFCNELDIDILQFAHVDLKKYVIQNRYLRMLLLIKEIEKCEIMCANCHIKFDLKKIQLRE